MWVVIYAFPFCHLERKKCQKVQQHYIIYRPQYVIWTIDFSGKLNKARSAKLKLESGMNLQMYKHLDFRLHMGNIL